jgi:hypothetical protein
MAQYERFWTARRRTWPGRPRMGIWVVEGETLLCGVGVFLTDGPYALLEGFATNPEVAPRVRHKATEFLLESTQALAAMLDKAFILNPSVGARGVLRIGQRLGYKVGTSRPMFAGV